MAEDNTSEDLRFASANASVITRQLWIGGDLGMDDEDLAHGQLEELVAAGLTHILDTREEWDDTAFVAERSPDVAYRHVGVPDLGQRMDDSWFADGTAFALQALQDEDAHVLIHCHAGINRGPSMGYATMLMLGWSPGDALAAITAARPIAWIDYAEDATQWWATTRGLSEDERAEAMKQVASWRAEHGAQYGTMLRQHRGV